MTLGKIIIHNSVRYLPKSQQTREIKQNTIKSKSTPGKQKKYFIKNKKFLNNVAPPGFVFLKWTMNCYFRLRSIQVP